MSIKPNTDTGELAEFAVPLLASIVDAMHMASKTRWYDMCPLEHAVPCGATTWSPGPDAQVSAMARARGGSEAYPRRRRRRFNKFRINRIIPHTFRRHGTTPFRKHCCASMRRSLREDAPASAPEPKHWHKPRRIPKNQTQTRPSPGQTQTQTQTQTQIQTQRQRATVLAHEHAFPTTETKQHAANECIPSCRCNE